MLKCSLGGHLQTSFFILGKWGGLLAVPQGPGAVTKGTSVHRPRRRTGPGGHHRAPSLYLGETLVRLCKEACCPAHMAPKRTVVPGHLRSGMSRLPYSESQATRHLGESVHLSCLFDGLILGTVSLPEFPGKWSH